MSYLKEKNGANSSIRLIFVFGSFWAMAMCTALAFIGETSATELIIFYSGIQAVLGGLKLVQKPLEK